jgi:hypothetical protein
MRIGNRTFPAARRMLIHLVMYSDIPRVTLKKALVRLERKFGKDRVANLRALVL